MRVGSDHRRDQNKRNDPQRERNAEHGAGGFASKLVREQSQGNRHHAGAYERADLGQENAPVDPVGERRKHRTSALHGQSAWRTT